MRVTKNFPTQHELKCRFEYHISGGLKYKYGKNRFELAGNANKTRHWVINIEGRRYAERDLIYIWHHGAIEGRTFNINGDKKDNTICNIGYIPRADAVSFM